MKKFYSIVIFLAIFVGGIIYSGSSQAAETGKCVHVSTFSDLEEGLDPNDNTFDLSRCKNVDFSVFKLKANTETEYNLLKNSWPEPKSYGVKSLFCEIASNRGQMIYLSYRTEGDLMDLNKTKKAKFEKWLKKYDKSHNCTLV